MDTCKIGPGLYQYTSVDDCTRYRVLRLYSRRTAANTLDFIDCVIEEMPFPIQRFQTDRGREFFAVKVQERLKEYGIKFRPNKPASPHLNGKVERSQKTDKAEFYATVDLSADDLKELLAEWQHYYRRIDCFCFVCAYTHTIFFSHQNTNGCIIINFLWSKISKQRASFANSATCFLHRTWFVY